LLAWRGENYFLLKGGNFRKVSLGEAKQKSEATNLLKKGRGATSSIERHCSIPPVKRKKTVKLYLKGTRSAGFFSRVHFLKGRSMLRYFCQKNLGKRPAVIRKRDG